MSQFRYSICEPLIPDVIEKGNIDAATIISFFENYNWPYYLEQEQSGKKAYYSPSLEFENKSNKNGLSFSAVGKPDKFEFYIFYKRPKIVKKWFGLSTGLDNNFLSELTGKTKQEAIRYLQALIDNKSMFLEGEFVK